MDTCNAFAHVKKVAWLTGHSAASGETVPEGLAVRVARAACTGEGWDPTDLRLLGPVGENASFTLPRERVVLRVTSAQNTTRAAREVRVAQWLLSQGFPAARPIRSDLLAIDGQVVSMWEEIPDPATASTHELGDLLRHLHALTPPADVALPALDPLAGVEDYLHSARGLGTADADFLHHRLDDLRQAFTELDFALEQGPIHGDAHRKNVLRGPDGRVVLLDLERFSTGPREWDLIVAATYAHLGWYSAAEYAAFVDAYGFDIRNWPGCTTLVEIRKLRMTAWLCARTGREPRLRAEAKHRITTLRTPSSPGKWTPGA